MKKKASSSKRSSPRSAGRGKADSKKGRIKKGRRPVAAATKAADETSRRAAEHHYQVLEDNAQIAHGTPLAPGQTHAIEPDAAGVPQLVRKRFSIA